MNRTPLDAYIDDEIDWNWAAAGSGAGAEDAEDAEDAQTLENMRRAFRWLPDEATLEERMAAGPPAFAAESSEVHDFITHDHFGDPNADGSVLHQDAGHAWCREARLTCVIVQGECSSSKIPRASLARIATAVSVRRRTLKMPLGRSLGR
jgi:hypothetical protein